MFYIRVVGDIGSIVWLLMDVFEVYIEGFKNFLRYSLWVYESVGFNWYEFKIVM